MLRLNRCWLALCLWAAPAIAIAQAAPEPLVVVELYTSQGCNACPPADAFIGQLSRRPDVLVLGLHVDYWDYLGWKDAFADHRHTERQQAYARGFGQRGVYTPQVVVAGRSQHMGSAKDGILATIEEDKARPELRLAVRLRRLDDLLLVQIGAGAYQGDGTIWLFAYQQRATIEIKRGENAGRSMTYHNVVRGMRNLGMWRGQEMEIAVQMDDLFRDQRDGCAVVVQQGMLGPVLGAAKLEPGRRR
ncbi:MAG: DUF1223 domain-containing protein [Alphaproteobacteria bacterium]|nr:DUF1223 domain-containing protein [Alphaproteobacteria bacterium]